MPFHLIQVFLNTKIGNIKTDCGRYTAAAAAAATATIITIDGLYIYQRGYKG
jgi:hypothetical protein